MLTDQEYLETCQTQEILQELSRRFNSWILTANAEGRKPGQRDCCCFYGGSIAEAKGLSDLSQMFLAKEMMRYIGDE